MIRQARAMGKRVVAVKPLISGFEMENLAQTDTGILIEALALAPTPANVDRISPWRYAAPLAPSVAARREGRVTDFERLVAFSREAALSEGELVLVEGVGGVMAPLDDRSTVLDWVERTGIPALLVVGSYLGAFSHALTARQAMEQRGVRIAAVVVNESQEPSLTLRDTVDEFRKWFGDAPVIGLSRGGNGRELSQLLNENAP
jgi:dethiobiotin synthetase